MNDPTRSGGAREVSPSSVWHVSDLHGNELVERAESVLNASQQRSLVHGWPRLAATALARDDTLGAVAAADAAKEVLLAIGGEIDVVHRLADLRRQDLAFVLLAVATGVDSRNQLFGRRARMISRTPSQSPELMAASHVASF